MKRKHLLAGIAAMCGAMSSPSALAAGLTADVVNAAEFGSLSSATDGPDPLIVKLQILLDRANASPGVIDGFLGENVAKAISAFETANGLPVDGELDEEVWSALDGNGPERVLVEYEVTQEDAEYPFLAEIPEDYAEQAHLEHLGYVSLAEMLAERFHMGIDLFQELNANVEQRAGASVIVADVAGSPPTGDITRIEVDKGLAKLRAYGPDDRLIVSYPATIGSAENPSPSGTHEVTGIAVDPVYYYNPSENFQQGENTEPLELPPGPNNPVGTVWISLSEPSYGVHGTPEPSRIDKTSSHGCIRLTNWDAEELAQLVKPGVVVEFIE